MSTTITQEQHADSVATPETAVTIAKRELERFLTFHSPAAIRGLAESAASFEPGSRDVATLAGLAAMAASAAATMLAEMDGYYSQLGEGFELILIDTPEFLTALAVLADAIDRCTLAHDLSLTLARNALPALAYQVEEEFDKAMALLCAMDPSKESVRGDGDNERGAASPAHHA